MYIFKHVTTRYLYLYLCCRYRGAHSRVYVCLYRYIYIYVYICNTLLTDMYVDCRVAGIGVPILLAYVYGVVPVSLCRSGGCGVTTNTGGVRFEFDENIDSNQSGKFQFRGNSVESVLRI